MVVEVLVVVVARVRVGKVTDGESHLGVVPAEESLTMFERSPLQSRMVCPLRIPMQRKDIGCVLG